MVKPCYFNFELQLCQELLDTIHSEHCIIIAASQKEWCFFCFRFPGLGEVYLVYVRKELTGAWWWAHEHFGWPFSILKDEQMSNWLGFLTVKEATMFFFTACNPLEVVVAAYLKQRWVSFFGWYNNGVVKWKIQPIENGGPGLPGCIYLEPKRPLFWLEKALFWRVDLQN